MPQSPEALLHSEDCLAQSVSVSNDHATILLQTQSNTPAANGETKAPLVRSLLKLSVLPTHTTALEPRNDKRGLTPKDLETLFCDEESKRIRAFLSSFDFCLSSESGAEYSYYDAVPKTSRGGGGFFQVLSSLFPTSQQQQPTSSPAAVFRVELISPASERQIRRAMPIPGIHMIEETPELYQSVVAPYIESVVNSGQLSWIDNVISGKKEKERLLLDTEHYILNVDTKWKTHPDANVVPRDEWKTYTKAIEDCQQKREASFQ